MTKNTINSFCIVVNFTYKWAWATQYGSEYGQNNHNCTISNLTKLLAPQISIQNANIYSQFCIFGTQNRSVEQLMWTMPFELRFAKLSAEGLNNWSCDFSDLIRLCESSEIVWDFLWLFQSRSRNRRRSWRRSLQNLKNLEKSLKSVWVSSSLVSVSPNYMLV